MGVSIEKGTKVSVFATLQHVQRHALVTDFHKVEHIAAASNKEELHNRIIQRDPFPSKQAYVARYEDEHIRSLCRAGTSSVCRFLRESQHIPRHDLEVWILCRRIKRDARCDKSPGSSLMIGSKSRSAHHRTGKYITYTSAVGHRVTAGLRGGRPIKLFVYKSYVTSLQTLTKRKTVNYLQKFACT